MNIVSLENAQLHCIDGLQILVQRSGSSDPSLVIIPQHELIRFLNAREETALSKNNTEKPVRRIALDFDGTVCDHDFPRIGAPKAGVKDAIERLKALGFYILIWSCRTSGWDYSIFGGDPAQHTLERPHVKAMAEWLKDNGIPYDEIDDGSRGKPLAEIYVDDKAWRFDHTTNWFTIANAIERAEMERNK
jgi:hypothetical protein